MPPFFSIVIPTYNRAALLQAALKSMLEQRFQDFEIIIVDDGSTDHTQEAVQKYLSDKRISYFLKSNGERGAARNFGRFKAQGRYINFFDSDDLMYPNHLEVAHDFITKSNMPEVIHLSYEFRTPGGDLIYSRNSFDDNSVRALLYDNILSCNGVFIRKDIAENFPFEEERIMASAEDWGLWIKLVSRYDLHFCNIITTIIVGHDARSIWTINLEKVIARDLFLISYLKADDVVKKYYRGGFARFVADRYSFFMLGYAEKKSRSKVLHWAVKALSIYPPVIFSKRFLASLKNIL